tara:strand:- start:322 stop:1635 length:1314 start_codon:yes stop_codon:yes gene_type:complete
MRISKKLLTFENKINLGQNCFYIGSFFLASALPISGIFYLIALLISIFNSNFKIFRDKWNISLLIIGSSFLISHFYFYFYNQSELLSDFNKSESLFNLFNWFPLFLIFFYFKVYLKSINQREIFSKFLISGTIPVLISCLLQKWFKVYGPLKTLGGLIIWFNKPLEKDLGVSGLFNNANYTGFWLTITLPLLIYLIFIRKRNTLDRKKIFLILILLLALYFTLSTYSRNALLGIFTSFTFIFGIKSLLIIFFALTLIFTLINLISIFVPFLNFNLIDLIFENYLVEKIYLNSFNLGKNIRFNLWIDSVKLILNKPLFGYGATTFPIFYYAINPIYYHNQQHTHNIILQIAYDYGIHTAAAITIFISFLFYKTFITIKKSNWNEKENFFNKCWLSCFSVAIIHHLSDITYFDGKISILIWILITGSNCITESNTQKRK